MKILELSLSKEEIAEDEKVNSYKEMFFHPSTLWILDKKAANNTSLPSNQFC